MTTLRFSKVREVKTPQRGTPGSAGVDFFVPEGVINDVTTIGAHMSKSIPSGIRADVPEGSDDEGGGAQDSKSKKKPKNINI